jgi:FkbM family methyltransferase
VDIGVPGFREASMIRPLESLISTYLRARLVDHRLRFAAYEVLERRSVQSYGVRETGQQVFLEHGTPDVYGFDQAFYQHLFEPPAAVLDALAAIAPAPAVLDLGANIGLFCLWAIARYPAATLTAFEPDARNLRLLQLTRQANDLESQWQVVEAAVGTASGEIAFRMGDFGKSRVVADGEKGAVTVPLVDFFDYTATAELIKMDVEGAEWAILEDERFSSVTARVIALDYHASGSPSSDPHRDARELTERHGYSVAGVSQEDETGGMLWCWR